MKFIAEYPERPPAWKANKKLSPEPTIHEGSFVKNSHLGEWTELMRGSILVDSTFGDYSYTAGDVMIMNADVGKFCSIASHTRINPGNHPMWRPTQAHFTYRRKQYGFDDQDDEEFFAWRKADRCTIGHDVWIGHGALIMPGVSIGIGSVVGAGAVVTKNVPPYTIVGGVPAKPIRQRFETAVTEQLLAMAWWDWDRATLEERFDDFLDMDAFLSKYGTD